MTDIKISELTNLAAVPDDTDEFPFNDGSTTKAIAAGYLRRFAVDEETTSGAQSGAWSSHKHVALNNASAITFTVTGSPTAGDVLTVYVHQTVAHVLVLDAGVTFADGSDTVTFSTAGESLLAIARSATVVDIIVNNGGVLS